LLNSSVGGLERRAMKRFHLALGVSDVEASADDYSQRFGCRPDLLIPERIRCGARMRSTCRFGKWATKRVGLAGGHGSSDLFGSGDAI
jgi:hypothetical protein